jgi:hypothetical protein
MTMHRFPIARVRTIALLAMLAVLSRSALAQTPPVQRNVMIGMSESFSPKTSAAAYAAFAPALAAEETGGECSVIRTAGNGSTIVSAGFPARRSASLTVALTFDSAGHLGRYSERRGLMNMPPMASLTPEQRDSTLRAVTNATRTTTVTLDWLSDQGMAMNRGGGSPTDAIMGTVRLIQDLPQLGPVSARIERVRKLCGV